MSDGLSGTSAPESGRRRRWIQWTILGVLLLAPTLRIISLIVTVQGMSGIETLIYVLVVPVVGTAIIVVLVSTSVGRGLPRLHRMYPDAVALATVLAADNLDAFRALTGVRLPVRAGFSFDTTFEPTSVRFWRGVRPRLIAQIPAEGLVYEAGERTTMAGLRVPAIVLVVHSVPGPIALRLSPQDRPGGFYPKNMNREQVAALVDQLNDQRRQTAQPKPAEQDSDSEGYDSTAPAVQ